MRDLTAELENLYRRRYVAFRNGLLSVTGSMDAARDAVQEGFARALRDQQSFRGEGSLEAWVWRIAFRAALQGRSREGSLPEIALEPSTLAPAADPELARAVAALPPRRRLIVFLRYFADLSYAEIAELCEISPGTVAAALARAHADLSSALTREEAPR